MSTLGPVDLWLAEVPRAPEPADTLLDATERDHARRYADGGDRSCFIARRTLRRRVLAGYASEAPALLRFDTVCKRCGDPAHGRPRLAGHAEIAFSATSAWVAGRQAYVVALAVARRGCVGVDVASIHAVRSLTPSAFLAPGEPPVDRDDVTASWTGKEAVLKLLGTGLAIDPRSLRITPTVRLPHGLPQSHDVQLTWRALPGARLAVAWSALHQASAACVG